MKCSNCHSSNIELLISGEYQPYYDEIVYTPKLYLTREPSKYICNLCGHIFKGGN